MAQSLRIALGADHGGFDLKQQLVVYLQGQGHQIRDCGTNSTEAVDYPVFAEAVARLVGSGACDFGIVVDGAGIGSAMAANKVPDVLAAACYNETLARNSREHNDANVLTLGSGQVDGGPGEGHRRRLSGDRVHGEAAPAARGHDPRHRAQGADGGRHPEATWISRAKTFSASPTACGSCSRRASRRPRPRRRRSRPTSSPG